MPKFAVEVLAETKLSAKEAHFGVDFITFFAPSEKTEREHLPAVPTAQPTAGTFILLSTGKKMPQLLF